MISSTSNPKVKYLVQLQKKRKLREEKQIFIVEGIRMFGETPAERILEIYASESFYKKHKELIEEKNKYIEVVTDTVFQKISETKTPQGILCIVKRVAYTLEQMMAREDAHFIVLEDLQDPGNVGTILRTAEAAGVTGIIMSKDTADLYQSKTIRSTMGSIFRMPCVCVENMLETLQMLKENEFLSFAAHLEGKKWYNEVDYKRKVAFLIGNEGNGLSEAVSKAADVWIKIPMAGDVESLNAATAATILMYEAYRQRRS